MFAQGVGRGPTGTAREALGLAPGLGTGAYRLPGSMGREIQPRASSDLYRLPESQRLLGEATRMGLMSGLPSLEMGRRAVPRNWTRLARLERVGVRASACWTAQRRRLTAPGSQRSVRLQQSPWRSDGAIVSCRQVERLVMLARSALAFAILLDHIVSSDWSSSACSRTPGIWEARACQIGRRRSNLSAGPVR